MLVNGTARDDPGRPAVNHDEQRILARASKSIGLCNTPSIVVPSWLFHATTSRVLVVQFEVCAFMSVSLRGCRGLGHRLRDVNLCHRLGSDSRNATADPSFDIVTFDMTTVSDGASRFTALLSGSTVEVRPRPLRCGEEQPVRSPCDDRRILVERGAQDGGRAAARRHGGDHTVGVEEVRACH